MTDTSTNTAKAHDMPEDINLVRMGVEYREGWSKDPDATRYIRADLVPVWQDIATAPKDGRWIYVMPNHMYGSKAQPVPNPFVVKWAEDIETWEGQNIGCHQEKYLLQWHPLPQPPQSTPQEAL